MIAELAYGLTIGAAAGAVFFVGLWWTVNRLVDAERPGLRLAGSAVARGSVVLAAFWFALQFGLPALLASLVAFLAIRTGAVRAVGRPELTSEPSPGIGE